MRDPVEVSRQAQEWRDSLPQEMSDYYSWYYSQPPYTPNDYGGLFPRDTYKADLALLSWLLEEQRYSTLDWIRYFWKWANTVPTIPVNPTRY